MLFSLLLPVLKQQLATEYSLFCWGEAWKLCSASVTILLPDSWSMNTRLHWIFANLIPLSSLPKVFRVTTNSLSFRKASNHKWMSAMLLYARVKNLESNLLGYYHMPR